jgi:hypothetical protein
MGSLFQLGAAAAEIFRDFAHSLFRIAFCAYSSPLAFFSVVVKARERVESSLRAAPSNRRRLSVRRSFLRSWNRLVLNAASRKRQIPTAAPGYSIHCHDFPTLSPCVSNAGETLRDMKGHSIGFLFRFRFCIPEM